MSGTSVENVYHHKKIEKKWYKTWRKNDLFKSKTTVDQPLFSIIFPAPDITRSHPADQCLQTIIPDIISRRKRMMGLNTMWIPQLGYGKNEIQLLIDKQSLSQDCCGYKTAISNKIKKKIRSIFVQLYREGKIYNHFDSNQRTYWFIKTKEMVKPAMKAVENGKITFIPDKWKKAFFNFMHNSGNWCISREIPWNDRIPAYHCKRCNKIMVEMSKPRICSTCHSSDLFQKEIYFDPHFSSFIWTLIQLGWQDNTKTFKILYPASLTVVKSDADFAWAIRMIMMGIYLGNDIPFREVLIHGPIKNARSNDPLDEYGSDPIRFSLAIHSTPGQKISLSLNRFKGCKTFTNKIWNASRYVIKNLRGDEDSDIDPNQITSTDKWILSYLNNTSEQISNFIENYRIGRAANLLYHFFWHEYCDWYIEFSKMDINNPGTRKVLKYTLNLLLKLLHPFMPFITEEIYHQITKDDGFLLQTEWPTFNSKYAYTREFVTIELLKKLITETRKLKIENRLDPFKKKINVFLKTESDNEKKIISKEIKYFNSLIKSTRTEIVNDFIDCPKGFKGKYHNWEILIPFYSESERIKDLKKLENEFNRLENHIRNLEIKLADEVFIKTTPASTVTRFKNNLQQLIEKREKIQKTINDIS